MTQDNHTAARDHITHTHTHTYTHTHTHTHTQYILTAIPSGGCYSEWAQGAACPLVLVDCVQDCDGEIAIKTDGQNRLDIRT